MITKSASTPVGGSITICHLNMVSLVKNIENLEKFINELPRKPEIICISETRRNDESIYKLY